MESIFCDYSDDCVVLLLLTVAADWFAWAKNIWKTIEKAHTTMAAQSKLCVYTYTLTLTIYTKYRRKAVALAHIRRVRVLHVRAYSQQQQRQVTTTMLFVRVDDDNDKTRAICGLETFRWSPPPHPTREAIIKYILYNLSLSVSLQSPRLWWYGEQHQHRVFIIGIACCWERSATEKLRTSRAKREYT